MTFLLEEGVDSALRDALRQVLQQLYQDAWAAGVHSATATGASVTVQYNVRDFWEQYGRQWVNEIVQTRINGLADILASGIDSPTQLADALKAYLGSQAGAEMIAQTEVTRAMSLAALQAYKASGIGMVRWLTVEDSRVCAKCDANEAAGPRPIGTPFPSGDICPPGHPRCRCAAVPAMEIS